MTDWENLRCFAALARGGTLSAAARLLGVEHATIARRVAALEVEAGLKLIDRRGRRLQLTADGERVARLAERMEESAAALPLIRAASSERLSGEVRISAPPTVAATMLGAPIAALRAEHPDIDITLVGETRYASLDRREADIAIRMTKPEAGDVVLFALGQVRFRLFATPDYLATVSPPEWRFIGYDEAMDSAPQMVRLREIAGNRRIGLKASTLEFQLAAARAGAGLAYLPDFMARGLNDVESPQGDEPPLVRDVWLAVHSELVRVPVVRAVIDALKPSLVAQLWG
ncbi:MAG: LysR family transcriptional regulator [Proteobacteria bacterium]|nr:LysR family transcriptional regulator [Pseudomonadota bacterium]